MDKRLLILGLLAVCASLLAWILVRPPDAGPPVSEVVAQGATPAPPVPLQRVPKLASSAAEEPAPPPAERATAPELPDTDVALALGVGAPVDAIDPTEPAAARVQLIEESVLLVLTSVAPELSAEDVTRTCAKDGSSCTFEGPWPGDDFFTRWVQAIGDGRVASEDLRGVTFRSFQPSEGDAGERIFRIVAVAPQ